MAEPPRDLNAPFSAGTAARSEGTAGSSPTEPRRSSSWSDIWPWLVSGVAGGVIVLLIEINKSHYTGHHLSGRIGGGVIFWLAFTTLVRFVIWIAQRASRL
jgi:hypothetical protein